MEFHPITFNVNGRCQPRWLWPTGSSTCQKSNGATYRQTSIHTHTSIFGMDGIEMGMVRRDNTHENWPNSSNSDGNPTTLEKENGHNYVHTLSPIMTLHWKGTIIFTPSCSSAIFICVYIIIFAMKKPKNKNQDQWPCHEQRHPHMLPFCLVYFFHLLLFSFVHLIFKKLTSTFSCVCVCMCRCGVS